ncbi:MAG: LytTR family DNA-binding domain-containing protein [Candidatus Latescibacterota bacterium]|jgi:two-component system LytT family response regulator
MLKILIVDDEAPARKRLKKLLDPMVKDNRVSIEGEAADGFEALDELEKKRFDVVFLDIQMPEMTGFDVLERLPENDRPIVIFATAHDEYAVKAFEANAIDYLLKPIDKKRLEKAISRAERLAGKPEERAADDKRFNVLLDWLDEQVDYQASKKDGEDEYLKQLSVPYRDRLLIIPVQQIVAAEVRDGITRLVVLDEKPGIGTKTSEYIVSYTLEQLESNLHPDDFMRVHRSSIVRLDAIKEMVSWFSGRYKLILVGGHEVISSRERSKLLRAKMTI